MTKPNIQIHNLETGEIINREMNDIEFLQYQVTQEADAQRQAEAQAKAAAKAAAQAKLAALGLNLEDLQALGL